MRTAMLALQIASASVAHAPATPVDSTKAHAYADSAVHAFLKEWRTAWAETQDQLRPPNAMDMEFQMHEGAMRALSIHCHWPLVHPTIARRLIRGPTASQATCPGWYPLDAPPIDDERRNIDAALTPTRRLKLRQFRSIMRSELDVVARQIPGDMFITRQRVRFAIDDGDLAGAAAAAAACQGDPADCGFLQAFILYRAGIVSAADSAFLAAARLLPDSQRCTWNDVAVLLDDPGKRRDYQSMSCAERADVEARFWWLSDPLFVEAGNERRAEHFVRKVQISLMESAEDERQHLEPKYGGEGVTENLVRYGWPTQLYWGGFHADQSHHTWLTICPPGPGPMPPGCLLEAPPYVVPEYTRGRLHTVPAFSAIIAPFKSQPEDWQLNGPADVTDWWPVEHFGRDASHIVQLPLGQSVMLRRFTATRFVWAGDLDPARLGRATGDSVSGYLFESRSPTELVNVQLSPAHVGRPLVIDAPMVAGDALIGVEIPGDARVPAARTRFGVSVIEPLNALAGARAVSQPLLFDPPAVGAGTLNAEAALGRMYGTTTLTNATRIGIYWEAYGFSAADTVETIVRVRREDRGILSQVTGVLRLSGEDAGGLGLRWTETPGNTRAIQRAEGNVPMQMRSIVLDVSQLPPGSYSLDVTASHKRGSSTSIERRFVLK